MAASKPSDDDVRWTCLRVLKAASTGSNSREDDCLSRFRSLIDHEPLGSARQAAAVRQLRVVAALIEPLEQLYQSLLFLFDEVRAAATENVAGCPLASLDQRGKATDALTVAQRSARELRKRFTITDKVDATVSTSIFQAMRDSGIIALAEQIPAVGTVAEAAGVLLQRHAAVQSGKFDRGLHKAPWLRLDNGTARLSSQRHELPRGQHASSWRNISRHPYRTSAAGSFIQQCRIA
jgi:hypothetical protein